MKERYDEAKKRLLECYDLYKNGNYNDFLVSLEELKKNIFNVESENDPFWMNGAGDLFTGIVYEIFKNYKKEELNFLNIFKFKINNKENIDDITSYVEKLDKNSYSYMCLSSVSASPKETRDSIVYVFKQVMKLYTMFDTNN